MIDTEAGRARHYSDQFRFDVGDLRPPFEPHAYADAIFAADDAKYPVIVVDSMSHEWAGQGGVLEMQEAELDRMAGDDYKKRESCKMAAWIRPKMEHKKMVQRLLQVRAHLIICFRAEEKVEMVRDEQTKKMVIVPKVSLTGINGWIPVCEKNLPFELTASFLLTADAPGIPKPIKLQDQHRSMFPANKPITEESGKLVAAWASGGSAATTPKKVDVEPKKPDVETMVKFLSSAQTIPLLEKAYDKACRAVEAAKDDEAMTMIKSAYDGRITELSGEVI